MKASEDFPGSIEKSSLCRGVRGADRGTSNLLTHNQHNHNKETKGPANEHFVQPAPARSAPSSECASNVHRSEKVSITAMQRARSELDLLLLSDFVGNMWEYFSPVHPEGGINLPFLFTTSFAIGIVVVWRRYVDMQSRAVPFTWAAPEVRVRTVVR